MRKTLVVMVTLLVLLFIDAGVAQAWPGGWRRRGRTTYVPATNVQMTQGQSGTDYRSFSYEPTTTPVIQPTPRQATRLPPHMNAGGHTAGYKLTDF